MNATMPAFTTAFPIESLGICRFAGGIQTVPSQRLEATMNLSAKRVFRAWCVASLSLLLPGLVPDDAHARQGVPPASFSEDVQPLAALDMVVLPPVDVEALRAEDEAQRDAGVGGPARFAAAISVALSPAADGTWETLPDRSRIWRLRIVSPGAYSLNFGCTRLILPPGATVHFYPAAAVPARAGGTAPSPDRRDDPARDPWTDVSVPEARTWDGPYESADTSPDGQFWTAIVPGDDALVELRVPVEAAFQPELNISQVGHDYRDFADLARTLLAPEKRQGACNIDVICPEGDPWRDQIRSVACYSLGGSLICTGSLLNSHNPAHPAYFLTANHCGISLFNAQSMVVYWNFESPTCGALSGGSLNQHQTGAQLRANYATSDFCLVQLLADPAPECNVYYSGWSARANTAPASAVCIHHPNCDEKAVSFCDLPLTITSYLQNEVPGDSTHWRVHHWNLGTTEPGSSGGGLWDPDHRLIGQLHGGSASCTSITSDWFGRLAISWNGGGNSSSRLRDWLDPSATGGPIIDGRNWDETTTGACCFAGGVCMALTEADCADQGGLLYMGDETLCDPNPCFTVGVAGTGLATITALQAAPNPFITNTTIHLSGPPAASARVLIFDAGGRLIRTAWQGSLDGRRMAIPWDGRDQAGREAPAGIYLVRVESAGGEPLVRLVKTR